MRFRQLDRITELVPGQRLRATRLLQPDEDLLKDHFPLFPVLPGVLMLESLFQAGMWLVLVTDDFARPMVTLHAARNVKYSDFVAPGDTLTVEVEIQKRTDDQTTLKGVGTVGGDHRETATAVTARLVLEHFLVQDRYSARKANDRLLRRELRACYQEIQDGAA